jgi:hypothetical protein
VNGGVVVGQTGESVGSGVIVGMISWVAVGRLSFWYVAVAMGARAPLRSPFSSQAESLPLNDMSEQAVRSTHAKRTVVENQYPPLPCFSRGEGMAER